MKQISPFSYSLILLFSITSAAASECKNIKSVPSLEIKVPSVLIKTYPSDGNMDLLHGNVISNLVEEYEVDFAAQKTGGTGYCLWPEKITATIGFSDFSVFIDRRHKKGGCEWNAISDHEDEHIAAHIAVISENMPDIEKSLGTASARILPVFVENEADLPAAMAGIEKQIGEAPEMRLMRQRLSAGQAVADKKIDLADRGWRIAECK